VWGSLIIVAAAQIGTGVLYPWFEQLAHFAGLAIGALASGLLSPHARWHRYALRFARVVTLAFAALAALSGLLVARTSIANSLDDAPRARHHVGDFAVLAPASWQLREGSLCDPDGLFELSLDREPAAKDIAPLFAVYLGAQTDALRGRTDQVDVATDVIVPLPAGWQGKELVVSQADPFGGRKRARVVVAARPAGDHVVLASLWLPETVARKAPAFFTRMLDYVVDAKR
jgi:hypothetical protein